jgi:hypothetical protein
MTEIASGVFERCLRRGGECNEEVDKQAEDSHSAEPTAFAWQGRAQAREEKKRKREQDIVKLEDSRAMARQFLQKMNRKVPKEDIAFLPSGNAGDESDRDGLEPDDVDVPDAIQVLEELIGRMSRKVRTAPFSKITRRISFVLLCHGHRGYELLQAVFGFPAVSTLWRKYSNKIGRMKEQVTGGSDGVARTIQDFRRQHNLGEATIHANLGVDAFSVIPEKTETDFQRYCFLFMLQPWDYPLKPIPLQILPHGHGQADQTIQNRISDVLGICAEMNVHVHFLCSDGDQGYSSRHKAFFQRWYGLMCDQGFDEAVAFVSAERCVPVLDFRHLAKSARSKLVRNPICLDPSSLQSKIDAPSMERILHLGDTLTDESTIGAMRDADAIRLFTFDNALKCVQNQNSLGAVYVLLFSLCASTLRPVGIPLSQRIFNAKLFFQLLHNLFLISRRPHAPGIKSTFRQGATATTLTTDINWIKLLNTAIGLVCYVVQAGSTGCGDRFGTHCLENFIGLVRRLSCGTDSLEVVNRNIAKTAVVRDMMCQLHIAVRHHRRENCGGSSFMDHYDAPFSEPFAIPDFVATALSLSGLRPPLARVRGVSRQEFEVHLQRLLELNEDGQKKPRLGFDDHGTLRNRAASERIMSMNLMSSRRIGINDE